MSASASAAVAFDAAQIVSAVLAGLPDQIGHPLAFDYRASGVIAIYRDTVSPEHRETVADILADRAKRAGWGYSHRLHKDTMTVTSTRLTHPSHLTLAGHYAERHQGGLGAALDDFAKHLGRADPADELAGSMQCTEAAAVTGLLAALGYAAAAAHWQAVHADGASEHEDACTSAARHARGAL